MAITSSPDRGSPLITRPTWAITPAAGPARLFDTHFPARLADRNDHAGIGDLAAGFNIEDCLWQDHLNSFTLWASCTDHAIRAPSPAARLPSRKADIRIIGHALLIHLAADLQILEHCPVNIDILAAQRAKGFPGPRGNPVIFHRGQQSRLRPPSCPALGLHRGSVRAAGHGLRTDQRPTAVQHILNLPCASQPASHSAGRARPPRCAGSVPLHG